MEKSQKMASSSLPHDPAGFRAQQHPLAQQAASIEQFRRLAAMLSAGQSPFMLNSSHPLFFPPQQQASQAVIPSATAGAKFYPAARDVMIANRAQQQQQLNQQYLQQEQQQQEACRNQHELELQRKRVALQAFGFPNLWNQDGRLPGAVVASVQQQQRLLPQEDNFPPNQRMRLFNVNGEGALHQHQQQQQQQQQVHLHQQASNFMMATMNNNSNSSDVVIDRASKRRNSSDSSSNEEIQSTSKRARGSVKYDKSESKPPSILSGENRLVIAFEKFGTKGAIPQTFGKSGVLIPDGLLGTHTVYQQKWKFEIYHGEIVDHMERDVCVCITWKVTNLHSGAVYARTETPREARTRRKLGRTIINQIFQEAMRMRAAELELLLENQEMDDIKRSNIKSLVQTLRPGRFTMGPLVFGLQHKTVQEQIGNTIVFDENLIECCNSSSGASPNCEESSASETN